MTAASPGPVGPNLFSMFSAESNGLYRAKRETFVFSLLGQAVILGLIVYFTSCVIRGAPELTRHIPTMKDFPVVFSGHFGGGGGNHDPEPASHGNPPRASLDPQLAPPTVRMPTEIPKLAVPMTVEVAPDVKLPQGGQLGDPMSKFAGVLSDGTGGPGGMGDGCCDGVGSYAGPHVGNGPPGIYPAGKNGVTVPEAIYKPDPSFSEEARKKKAQGVVTIFVVVGKDGRAHNLRVGQSAGMGLDEKALEAVRNWRFKPATLNGQPVATQIAVEVDFHLY